MEAKIKNLIVLIAALIMMSLFGIGILLALIIMCQPNSELEQYYEDLEQMEYLKNYKKQKELKKHNKNIY